MVTSCMTLTVKNQNQVDGDLHHLTKKRQSRCACFDGSYCNGDLNYNVGCGCMTCGAAKPIIRPTTVSPRCKSICIASQRTDRQNCPSCYSGADNYGGGYYCCGGSTASSCGGYFAGKTCACRGVDCVLYSGSGCGYFSSLGFDSACACFTCS
ncbi:unnamed protein product [Rotaria magnacalcarata]|nr:unnamed protein product [Rotaria magnacalcarata]CAF3596610.1 unnamed protein product [Rotaria socialis]